jgi:N-acetylglucosamine kinase-like BadF-type ATPase
MILVVDSGSTKADWALCLGSDHHKIIETKGLNPYFHGPDDVYEELSKKSFTEVIPVQEINEVFFYGAGCPDEFYRRKMGEGLKRVFTKAHIEVQHDLLGAARATCGRNPGIAGILGTGSNSCAYDGFHITDNIPALAHVLGDDGGGVHLGKLILQAYYYRELPEDLEELFQKEYPEGKDAIIHRIYGEGQNVHIAKFAEFLITNRTHSFAKELIHEAFRIFAVRHIKKYEGWKDLKINLVGSVAHLLHPELKEVFQQEGLQVGQIIRRPIENLIKFHLSERRL